MTMRAARDAGTAKAEQEALDAWFRLSGSTMTDFTAAITRWQPGDHPADAMGIHPEIIMPVIEHPNLHRYIKPLIVRAMQASAIRQNRRKSENRRWHG